MLIILEKQFLFYLQSFLYIMKSLINTLFSKDLYKNPIQLRIEMSSTIFNVKTRFGVQQKCAKKYNIKLDNNLYSQKFPSY